MASFYQSNVAEFLNLSDEQVLAKLSVAYANRGFTRQYSDQTLTWKRDIQSLRISLGECVQENPLAANWGILLEFTIPMKEARIDIVLLAGNQIAILEAKSSDATLQAKRQVEEYALLLHYFHKGSFEKRIIPIIVTPQSTQPVFDDLLQYEMFPQLSSYWISNVVQTSWESLPRVLLISGKDNTTQIGSDTWNSSPYHPVPTIIEAARALRTGLSIREIAHSEASEHEIDVVRHTIGSFIEHARSSDSHMICFLTGVPGSGKTLVGLSLAHLHEAGPNEPKDSEAVHFMSGNGPLVKVLQHLFTIEGRKDGNKAEFAKVRAGTLIQNVHRFATYYMDGNQASPSSHAIIFDEAQRAWSRVKNLKKFNRDCSEPAMLLKIMERHNDWAAVIALVGGGQEIHDGEAGLEEWGRALAESSKNWQIYASPEVIEGGASTAGHRLFDSTTSKRKIIENSALHLRTSNRSLRSEKLASWVNYVIEGKAEEAASLGVTNKFPIFLSRSLGEVKRQLTKQGIGQSRCGLVGSSGAARLRAEGLEPDSSFHRDYSWEHWYLAGREDVRSSFQCEVFATEFEIQGLELDWIGLCWGGDFVWSNSEHAWQLRTFRPGSTNRWLKIKDTEKQTFRRNSYRVLLTRARQGMIIFVPKGSSEDPTNSPNDFDRTAGFLLRCGVTPLPSCSQAKPTSDSVDDAPQLFT